jgi:protein CpxP
MFKKSLLALTLAGLIYAAPAMAQDAAQNSAPSQAPAAGEMHHGRHQMDPARRSERLSKKLNLNADQQAKVQDIFKSEQSQMQSLRSESSLSQQDRRAKMMDIHKSSSDQVRAVLNPDQQKKWDDIQAKREQKWQSRHGGNQPQS